LLEACKNPFDTKERKYAPLEDLPLAMPEKDARALIERIRVKYSLRDPDKVNLVALKEEILSRPRIQPEPIPMTPEHRVLLLASLKRALELKYEPHEAQRYIAELPPHEVIHEPD
jgi:hypothetical protein